MRANSLGTERNVKSLKYIVVRDHSGGERAIVFDPVLNHSTVAGHMKVVSAGHCRLPGGEILRAAAWGKSTSIGVSSRPEDADIIQRSVVDEVRASSD